MIDRGALIVERRRNGGYRGVQRAPLDALCPDKKQKKLRDDYRALIVEGDGVLTDLDEAIALLKQAIERKIDVELIVFEVPQEAMPTRTALPLALEPPADNLVLLGYDVIELLEPYCSQLAISPGADELNEHGLLPTRGGAEGLAKTFNAQPEIEDPLHAVRVWVYSD